MTTNIKEIAFEAYIEKYLLEKNEFISRNPSNYDKTLCLDKGMVIEFLKTTQEKEWNKLISQHGEEGERKFFKRLTDEIKVRGVLDVLRNGIKDNGTSYDIMYSKPVSNLNNDSNNKYESNIFTIVRQLKYSLKNENSIDMVMFLNGLPIFTIELKNQLTGQSVEHAKRQYKTDRDQRETLLSFKTCLVHFTVDTDLAYMTTKLDGLKTFFLPFNKGDNCSSGNPVNPKGYKTSYIWEDIWTKDNILEIVSRFMHLQKIEEKDEAGKKQIKETLIFPRYHQFDTVRRIISDILESNDKKNYLIEHSAGSGKSNSIAWVAHHLVELHNKNNEKIYDTIIVITDRRVLDKQLRNTIMQFAQVDGVVKPITEGSQELKKALEDGEKIIITTLQKFPYIVDSIGKIKGKSFAVIIDEAHSSQSGESVKSMKQVLNTTLEKAEKEDEVNNMEDAEDWILNQIRSRQKLSNVSFLAFTATPKQKTLEIFGTQSSIDNKFYPFSLYSMKQAIEEGFILDVLKNYTTYKTYFNLVKKIENDAEYKKKEVVTMLVNYVSLHEHAIAKKIEVIVSHFIENIRNELNGKAKAMIVTKSRLHAVKFKQAIDIYFREKHLNIGALVAFSGTVKDEDGFEYTESNMNGIPEKNTAEEFKNNYFKFLIVAEKFQTGFDQPLLTAMYVDKKLGGVNAVQTLSRLNRMYPGKEETFVLDFVNETDDIKESFQPYYTTTILSESTDPNILHDLQRDILEYRIFDEREVDSFIGLYSGNSSPDILNSFLDEIVIRYKGLDDEAQDELKTKITDYIKKYAFISQIISFEDTSLEKLYIFVRLLRKKFPFKKGDKPVAILDMIDLESIKNVKKGKEDIKLENADGLMEPMEGSGRGIMPIEEVEMLSKIIKDVNDKFGTNFSPEDRVILNNLSSRLLDNKQLVGTMQNNPKDTAKIKFDEIFQEQLVDMFKSNFDLYQKLDSNNELKEYVNHKMFEFVHKKLVSLNH